MNAAEKEWTNPIVQKFAGNDNPIDAIRHVARNLVLKAIEMGWKGPPFDPFELASFLDIRLKANASINDALLRQDDRGNNLIEFNPNRHISRLKFSIAHEIAHTFFPNFDAKPQHRGKTYYTKDDWQIEALCNIAAAEILIPMGLNEIKLESRPSIEEIMHLRRTYAVSSEAMLIHISKLFEVPCAAFCASRVDKSDPSSRFQIDYLMGNSHWNKPIRSGTVLSHETVLDNCSGIGFTSQGNDDFGLFKNKHHVECVGLPPYPESKFPRVAGIIFDPDVTPVDTKSVQYRHGDAANPPRNGKILIAHVVNDKARSWGGRGFAQSLAKMHPESLPQYKLWFSDNGGGRGLGSTNFFEVDENLTIASMVAQHGYGKSPLPLIRYNALEECLEDVKFYCKENGYSIHAPRIGAGQAGGNWQVIEGILQERVLNDGVSVTIYDLPPRG